MKGLRLVQVLPGGKGPVAGAGEHHRPNFRVPVEAGEGARQLVAHGGMPGVEHVRAVEGDEADIVSLLDDQEVVHPVPFV